MRLQQSLDRWREELAPTATGWLGSTGGVTPDGEFVLAVRFQSEEAARRNSDRPEQGEWWQDFVQGLEGEPTVHDCPEVWLMGGGGSDDAGFVQVIEATVTDADRARSMAERASDMDFSYRPDIIGGSIAVHEDGRGVTQTVYFTSEEEAREGESREDVPAEIEEFDAELSEILDELRYLDLPDPWLMSA